MTVENGHHRSSVSSSLSSNGAVSVTDWRSIYFVGSIVVMDAIKISVVQVNSWPYLKSMDPEVGEEFYGVSKSAFTLGTMLASILAGYVSNKISHTKPPILAGTLLTLFCCLFYANMEMFSVGQRKWSFLILELVLGLGGGAVTIWRTILAMSSTDRDRKKATGVISFAINFGFILGPVVVLLWGLMSSHAVPLPWGSHLSIYTAPVYVQVLICLVGSVLLTMFFDGRMQNETGTGGKWAREGRGKLSIGDRTAEKAPLELAVPGNDRSPSPQPSPSSPSKLVKPCSSVDSSPDWLAIFACFVARINFAAFILYLIALAAPFAMTTFGWTGEQTVTYQMLSQGTMGLMGILISLGYALRILSRFGERHCILFALALMGTFFVVSFPWSFLTAEIPRPRYQETLELVNGTTTNTTRKLITNGCDRGVYNWCDSTPATNVYVYHVALILCLGLAMPVGQVNLDTLYSRLLGPIKQGTMQGLFFAVGEVITLCGPPVVNISYQWYGPRPVWTAQILLFSLSIALWLLCYRRLVPKVVLTPMTKLVATPPNGQVERAKNANLNSARKRDGLLHTD